MFWSHLHLYVRRNPRNVVLPWMSTFSEKDKLDHFRWASKNVLNLAVLFECKEVKSRSRLDANDWAIYIHFKISCTFLFSTFIWLLRSVYLLHSLKLYYRTKSLLSVSCCLRTRNQQLEVLDSLYFAARVLDQIFGLACIRRLSAA